MLRYLASIFWILCLNSLVVKLFNHIILMTPDLCRHLESGPSAGSHKPAGLKLLTKTLTAKMECTAVNRIKDTGSQDMNEKLGSVTFLGREIYESVCYLHLGVASVFPGR